MPKIRSIHPDACESEKLLALSDGAERTLWRLTTHSDDDGRGVDHPKLLANKLYPLDDEKTGEVIDDHLDELVQAGMLLRYEVDGKRFYEVHDFTDWQKPKYKADSKLPAPDDGTPVPPPSPGVDPIDPTPSPDVPHGDGGVSGGGDGDGSTSDVPSDPDVSEDARNLTREFARAVKANGHGIPKQGSKARDNWLIEMDRLLRLGPPGEGGHVPAPDEVRTVIGYVTTDSFEMANVQSVPKLRERYSALRLKALNGTKDRADPKTQRASVNSGMYREYDPDEEARKARELEQRLGITS